MDDLLPRRTVAVGRELLSTFPAVVIQGARQVGKSTLVERWLETCDGPSVFFEAHGYTETRELARFRDALASSSLPSAAQAPGVTFGDWQAALTTAAAMLDPLKRS